MNIKLDWVLQCEKDGLPSEAVAGEALGAIFSRLDFFRYPLEFDSFL